MTKSRFLIATAAAALIAGSAYAQSPASPPAQSGPSAGASGSMGGAGAPSGSMNSGAGMDRQGGANARGSGAATTGAGPGATTETNKADDFKTKGAAGATGNKSMPGQKGAQDSRSKSDKSETTGQAPNNRSGQSETNSQQRSGTGNAQSGEKSQSQEMKRPQTQGNQRNGQSGDNARAGGDTNVNVNLSTEQRTRIKEVIVRDKRAPRVADVNFSIHVGTAVPRTVKHVVVPQTIVEIHPAWRGFHYFMTGDQIVIIDPATFRIVAVLDA